MALDGITVAALVQELNDRLINTRVDKIYQPENDEIHLLLRGFGESHRLLLTANPNVMRVCFTTQTKENPATPPVFCMLLRKHLQGGKFLGAEQPGFERILRLSFESYDELGDLTTKHLIAELMGRHSNLILTDQNGRILDSIKRVDFSVSSVRQVLPGLPYENPPSQEKANPLQCGIDDILSQMSDVAAGTKCDQFFVSHYSGISPIIGREMVFRAFGDTERYLEQLDYAERLELATAAYQLLRTVEAGAFSSCLLRDKSSGTILDFSAIPLLQYADRVERLQQESISLAVETFYQERDRRERMRNRSASLSKLVATQLDRCAKKIILQKKEWSDTKKRDKWKRYGDLVTANLYQIEPGAKSVRVQDYFDESLPEVTVPLDPQLSPSANAQKFYKKYNKAKTAALVLEQQLALASEELEYLESVEEALSLAQTESDLEEIRMELSEQGYLKRAQHGKKKKPQLAQPLSFLTSDGFHVLVGRNNKQNDLLTLKTARNSDLWFHTKGFHGSHVLLRQEHGREFPHRSIEEAAMLAAWYSKARGAANVPVDYTEVRNVKKPSGAKPGMVIYDHYNTAYVTPAESLVHTLADQENR